MRTQSKKICRLAIAAWVALAVFMFGGPARAAVIYDGGDDGTADGGLLLGIAPNTIQALGSTIVTDADYFVTSIGVYVQSVGVDGALNLVVLPTRAYDGFDGSPFLPDPLDLLSSPFSAYLGSVVAGLNSVSVDWELPAGAWFIAAVPVIDTLQANLSGAVTPAAVNAHYGNNPFWMPMEGGFTIPSFRLEGVAVPEPATGMLLVLGAGAILIPRRRKN